MPATDKNSKNTSHAHLGGPPPSARPSIATRPSIASVGALRASGHEAKPVKIEIRDNLLARLRSGEPRFPGIVGFDETVLPNVERALLAGHDFVLLGERGQGKTRLIRTIAGLLDEWTPIVDGCEINDHPYAPVCTRCRRLADELGDDLPVDWKHRDERYGEKLATPDTSVGDLIGDVDPIKVAEGRTLGDPETVHYGLVPRFNRGIFSVNELPDLAERIQVSLLNVLEERDVQIRGYALRLPLDVLLIASANPEDYTNRGRIITPLKDRFGAEVRTHYPLRLADEVALISQEARAGGRRAALPARGGRSIHPPRARIDGDRSAVGSVGTIRGGGCRNRRGVGTSAGRVDRRAGRRGAGVRPTRHRRFASGQGRIRGQRGRSRTRRARAPVASRRCGDVPLETREH